MHAKAHRIRRICVATCAAPLLVLTGAAAAGAGTATQPVASQPTASEAVQQASASEILALVNAERQKADCPALTVNAKLTQAAETHAADMAKNNLTSHTGSDGSNEETRLERVGYNWRSWSENVSGPGYATSQDHVNGWLGSAAHKKAMLNCSFTETGVGVSGDRAVQLFAIPA
ncbi:CAP domain-containing protein [Streptomyces sp. NPDC000410]|uniref:CAP domain-containing protein n=1 Tax=Streptomyces sp. NPDC000410 TaxID=3154254 RepID=UPI00332B23CE